MNRHRLALLLSFLFLFPAFACGDGGATAPAAHAPAAAAGTEIAATGDDFADDSAFADEQAPATPPVQGDGDPLTVDEPSVLQGFDARDPVASAQAVAAGRSGSRLVLEKERVDLGDVYQHKQIPVEIPFRVEGDDPIVITALQPSCGCTDVHVRADWLAVEGGEAPRYVLGRDIPPGAHGRIVGTFDSERRRNEKVVKVVVRGNMTNDPVQAEVRAFVHPTFDVQPVQVRFGEVLAGGLREKDPSRTVRVTAKRPFELREWTRLPEGVRVEAVGEQVPTGEREEVRQDFRVTITKDAPLGLLSGSCIAATDLDADLEFLVVANVVGPIAYSPSQRLAFGIFPRGQQRTRTVEMRAKTPDAPIPPFEVEVTGKAGEHAVTEVQEIEPGRVYRVAVTFPAETPVGSWPGQLVFRFPDDSGLDDKSLSLNARVREPR